MPQVITAFDHTSQEAMAEMLKVCGACAPAQQWVNGRGLSLEQAFALCTDSGWFQWLVDKWRPDIKLAGETLDAMRTIVGSAATFAASILIVGTFALTGDGDGDGDGDGYGYGYGDGYGYGYGYGYGDGYG